MPASGTRTYDLIVLGAGPSGASAAAVAAASGLRTALVDKARFPRDKLCGGGITGRAMGHFRKIFQEDTPNIPLAIRRSISFHAFGTDLGGDDQTAPIYLGMRRQFDADLVRRALASGAEDFTGQSGALDPDAGEVRLASGLIRAPVIIAADGVNSPTARQLFGEAFDRNRIGFALEVESPDADPDLPLRIDFGAAEWGYGWQFPKHCGATLGVGGVLRRNPDMKSALTRYLDRLGVGSGLKVKGQFLPFGEVRKVPGRGRVLLAGDAAGLVDPITGEGIGYAMHSGALAAKAAIAALTAGDPLAALPEYRRRLRPVQRNLGYASLLRHIIYRPAFRPTFISSFKRSRRLRGEYLRLLAGETEYAALMQLTALRMPGFFLRSLRGA